MRIVRRARQVWRHKDDFYFYKEAPTQNLYYTVFEDHKGWKRLIMHRIGQTNNAVDIKNIQIKWTIDGNSWSNAANLEGGVDAWIYRKMWSIHISLTEYLAIKYSVLMAESIKLEMRIPSVPDATYQLIESSVMYEELEYI